MEGSPNAVYEYRQKGNTLDVFRCAGPLQRASAACLRQHLS